ncbi:hypothetical protein [Candidatus Methylobacter favarea]|uniref:hypothetical protein n=1 Tax=Candidatus Methylobacter favarea TaxID=2707345 RepID=UPI00157DD69F|nr:hypothetical protein [Candidatus Methylobacter favarea]
MAVIASIVLAWLTYIVRNHLRQIILWKNLGWIKSVVYISLIDLLGNADGCLTFGVLTDYERAYRLKLICLHYFYADRAACSKLFDERHKPGTYLISLLLQSISGRKPHISVFGRDYITTDGAYLPDYIHYRESVPSSPVGSGTIRENGARARAKGAIP